jgi:hypothetical protein
MDQDAKDMDYFTLVGALVAGRPGFTKKRQPISKTTSNPLNSQTHDTPLNSRLCG